MTTQALTKARCLKEPIWKLAKIGTDEDQFYLGKLVKHRN